MIYLVNINLPPEIRYKDVYTRQIGIIPGPNNPRALLDTFLQPIIDEAKKLSMDGLVTIEDEVEICKAKAFIAMVSGDLPAAGEVNLNT